MPTMAWLSYRVRAEVRTRWRSLLALAVVIAVVGGVVLATAAGARRTRTAVDRLDEAGRSPHSFLDASGTDEEKWDEMRRLPSVEYAVHVAFVYAFPGEGYFPFLAVVDPDGEVSGGVLVEGRRPRPGAADELVLSEATAKSIGVRAGSTLETVTVTPAGEDAFNESEDYEPDGPVVPLRVVGLVRSGQDLGAEGGDPTVTVLPYAFYEKYRGRIAMQEGNFLMRYKDGPAGIPQFTTEVRRLFAGGQVPVVDAGGNGTEGLKDSTNVQAAGLAAFAAVFLLFGLGAVGQFISRTVHSGRADHEALAAVGLTRRGRFLDAAVPPALAAALGCVGAVALAIAASPLLPVGLAGRAEPDPGLHVDTLVLLPGGLALLIAVLAVIAWPAWRRSRLRLGAAASAVASRPSLGSRLTRTGPPALAVGVDMAARRGRGATEVAVRTAVIGTLLGALGLAAAVVFSNSLQHLLDTPSRYGWTWDVAASQTDEQVDSAIRRADTAVVARAVLSQTVQIGNRSAYAFAFDVRKGTLPPPIVEGRAPTAPDEVALGAALREKTGGADTVTISAGEKRGRYRVVGTALSAPIDDPISMDGGVMLSRSGMERLGLWEVEDDSSGFKQTMITFKPGVDVAKAARTLGIRNQNDRSVTFPRPPGEVAKLDQVRDLPNLLALFLGALALVALLHAIVQTVHRRRLELGVLRAIGFTRGQVAGSIGWQASAVALVGAGLGLPLGIAVGRWLWTLVADGLGVAPAPQVALPLVALVPAAVAIAALVGVALGSFAGRTPAAVALRTE